MTVSYKDLKAKGACEKGLIWFAENCKTLPGIEIDLSTLKGSIQSDAKRIRDIYHADPDSWIKWLEEKYPEKPKFDNHKIYIAMCGGNHNKLCKIADKWRWVNINDTDPRSAVMISNGLEWDSAEDALMGCNSVLTFPSIASFAEWLYKETR